MPCSATAPPTSHFCSLCAHYCVSAVSLLSSLQRVANAHFSGSSPACQRRRGRVTAMLSRVSWEWIFTQWYEWTGKRAVHVGGWRSSRCYEAKHGWDRVRHNHLEADGGKTHFMFVFYSLPSLFYSSVVKSLSWESEMRSLTFTSLTPEAIWLKILLSHPVNLHAAIWPSHLYFPALCLLTSLLPFSSAFTPCDKYSIIAFLRLISILNMNPLPSAGEPAALAPHRSGYHRATGPPTLTALPPVSESPTVKLVAAPCSAHIQK